MTYRGFKGYTFALTNSINVLNLKIKIMKSRIILLAAAILMTSLFSNLLAQNKNEGIHNISTFQQVQLTYDEKDMLTLEYLDALSDGPWKMKVRIYKESGELLYTRVLRKKGNSRIGFDISHFPSGNYNIELYKNRELVYSKAIEKQIEFANVGDEKDVKPETSKFQQIQFSQSTNDMVQLDYLDVFAEGKRRMEVRIYEESGNLLYSKSLVKNGDVRIGFDISKFPGGNYTFELIKDSEPVCSELIVKQSSHESKESNLLAKEYSSK